MSTENTTTTDVTVEDNLDDFAASFFGGKEEPSGNAKPEDEQAETETKDGANEKEEDTHSADDGATEEEEEDSSTEENPDETDEDDKPKKTNRFQERINELTAKARQAERERDELKRQLEKEQQKTTPEPKKEQVSTPTEGPDPKAVNEDGSLKYPLGEYDPKYLKDVVQHMLNEERKAREVQEQEAQKLREQDAQRAAVQASWNEKLVPAKERYPDFEEKGQQMLSVFEGIDEAYGQYLTDTIMEMDAGPDVFYYLANNIEEAEAIVNAGPRKATIALAKLEAQLAGNTKPKTVAPKITKAATPPPRVKGSAVAKPSVPLDTDDLDAFSRELFKKK